MTGREFRYCKMGTLPAYRVCVADNPTPIGTVIKLKAHCWVWTDMTSEHRVQRALAAEDAGYQLRHHFRSQAEAAAALWRERKGEAE